MALHDNFPMVVERIDIDQTHLGVPDARGTYHQIQISSDNLLKLQAAIGWRLYEIERERITAYGIEVVKLDEEKR